MNIRLLEPAQAELDEAITWYAAQAPGLGDAFLIETLKTIKLIESISRGVAPTTHPKAAAADSTRFPYSVVYTLDGDEILVLAVAHQHRKPNYWRSRLG